MTCNQYHLVRLPGYRSATITFWIVQLMAVGMVSTVAAQTEFTRETPQPGFAAEGITTTIVPREPAASVGPQIISISKGCDSEINITYDQRNTIARVQGIVEKSSCPASHGEYTFVIGIRDENNKQSTLEFSETWQRNDDEPISFVKEYEIGESIDLTRVRLRSLRCSCEDAPAP